MKESVINGKTYQLENISGTVAEASKNIETRVGGGGGSINQGSGFIAPVMSVSIVHNQIFIIDRQGNERSLEIVGMNVACRPGHDIKVTKLIYPDGTYGYIAAANYTTKNVYFNVAAINKLFKTSDKKIILRSTAIGIIPFLLTDWFLFFKLFAGVFAAAIIMASWSLHNMFIGAPKQGKEFMDKFRIEDYD